MTETEGNRAKIVNKYRPYLTRKDKGAGGIFTTVMRGNLLGVSVKGRKTRDKDYDFFYDVRNQVKNALVDLELFIETAGEKNVNEILTAEALEPIVESLFWGKAENLVLLQRVEPDLRRANIAKLFVFAGFEYLRQMQKEPIAGLYKRAIEDAYLACNYLVDLVGDSEKGRYYPPGERRIPRQPR